VPDPGSSELPIFELPLAIVPSEHVPLHVFEPRYRAMVASCLEGDQPFGIVFRDADGARAIGCTAHVRQVVERYEDGRLDIIVRGGEPFRVLDRFEAAEWPAAQVQTMQGTDAEAAAGSEDELAAAREAFAELLEAVGAEPERAEGAPDAFAIAAQVELPGAEKHRLLEADGEGARLVALTASLRRVLRGIAHAREIGERAKSNGHRPGRIGPTSA